MSDDTTRNTEPSVVPDPATARSPVEQEKHPHISTSASLPASAKSETAKAISISAPVGAEQEGAHGAHTIKELYSPHANADPDLEKPTTLQDENGSSGADTTADIVPHNAEDANTDEDEIVYPNGFQLSLLTLGLCLATFTVALDNTIIATAIPKITTVFDSLNDVGWYGSSYLLTTTALQPSFGRIYTFFDVKRTYLFALCLFELGSIICAAARNSVMLIVGRAVAGAGASALFSGGMTIIGFSVPMARRPMYIAAISSMFGISSVIGPLLGGALTDRVSWRWCFWINLPFGAVALATVAIFFKPPKRKAATLTVKQRILEIDLVGALFLICAIVCLLLALQWGGSTYPWKDSKVWGCILGFGLLIIIFIAQQFRRGDRATIPPRIFGQRTVLTACLYSCFLSMGLYTHIYFLPFYFQAVKGTTAEGSGIRTIPYLGSVIISSIVAGAGITYIGWYKWFMIAGSSIFTVGAGLLYTLQTNSANGKWIGYQLICGFGAGAGIQIPFIAVQVVLNAKDMPSGNAIAIFFNSLGGAISISVAQNIFSNGLRINLPRYAPTVSPEVVISAGATYLRQAVSAAALPGVLEAYMVALTQAYIIPIAVGGVATICAAFVENRTVKGKKIEMGAVA